MIVCDVVGRGVCVFVCTCLGSPCVRFEDQELQSITNNAASVQSVGV